MINGGGRRRWRKTTRSTSHPKIQLSSLISITCIISPLGNSPRPWIGRNLNNRLLLLPTVVWECSSSCVLLGRCCLPSSCMDLVVAEKSWAHILHVLSSSSTETLILHSGQKFIAEEVENYPGWFTARWLTTEPKPKEWWSICTRSPMMMVRW